MASVARVAVTPASDVLDALTTLCSFNNYSLDAEECSAVGCRDVLSIAL